ADEARYGLRRARATAALIIPTPPSVTLRPRLGFSWHNPGPASGGGSPSVEQIYGEATAPGLSRHATYAMAGLSAAWRYPHGERRSGFSTEAELGYAHHFALESATPSFEGFDVTWSGTWIPGQASRPGARGGGRG